MQPENSSISEYTAITRTALIENTEIDFDLYLSSGTHGHSQYVLFCRGNEQFSQERREVLLKRNIDRLYISTEDNDKYLKYQEKNLKNIVQDRNISSREKSIVIYDVARNITADLLNDPKSGQNTERASEWVNNTVSHILNDEDTFTSLFYVLSNNYYVYTHSINVTVIGLLFGKYLSLKEHDLNCLGTGLLLHDIGKVIIHPDVINKSGRLTEEEFWAIKRHPKAGLDHLEHIGTIDGRCLKIVIQHHENYDGTGYPYNISGNDIHLFGRIARIIDVYDAMTSNRPYAAAKRPFAVLAEMKGKMSNCFDGELLKEFICFLGQKDTRGKPRKGDDGNSATADCSEQILIDLINQQPPLASTDLKNALITASPLSESVLVAMINRDPLMDTRDNNDVMIANNPLSDNFLSQLISITTLVMYPLGYRDVLVDNSPLSENILNQAINTEGIMDSTSYKDVLIANSPLIQSILDQVIAETPTLDANHYNTVMAAQ
jgi:HD-GYP domain-containing protein (c-di-GMP phosphodiesterase class II)